ncbi:alpha/beta hydrolase family protein [Oleiagrimonas soli]|nr:alpha/beta hydrolase [Oleiagrimonas soli]
MRQAVPADQLGQLWSERLAMMFGPHDAKAAGQSPRIESGVVVTPLRFARRWLQMQVRCDAKMDIASLRIVPDKDRPEVAAAHVVHAASGPWGHSEVTQVPSPFGPLPALLTLPKGKGPFPAVVMLAGSGPQDADESIGPNKPFRDLAQGLAAHGVASLRYQKRTYAYPTKSANLSSMSIDDEVTNDAVAALRDLRADPHVDANRVFVLGHSLGAMMAPRIGRQVPQVAGLVMLAAPARSLLAVVDEQIDDLGAATGMSPAQIVAQKQAVEAERKTLDTAQAGHPPAGKFMGIPQSYWMSLHDYDQVRTARALRMPMLFLQGGADFQVSPQHDFARWEAVFAHDPRVTLKAYPGLSHLFMPAGKTRSVKDYLVPAHVDTHVIDDIAAWIKRQPARKQ